MDLFSEKEKFLKQAAEQEYILFFEHDPEVTLGYLRYKNKKYCLETVSWED